MDRRPGQRTHLGCDGGAEAAGPDNRDSLGHALAPAEPSKQRRGSGREKQGGVEPCGLQRGHRRRIEPPGRARLVEHRADHVVAVGAEFRDEIGGHVGAVDGEVAGQAHLTVGGFRDWLLAEADPASISALAPGLTPEMVAGLTKICRLQDLVAIAAKCRVTTRFRNTLGLPGTLSIRLQPNDPVDDPKGIAAQVLDGLLHHGADLHIEEHHVDGGGVSDHVFALCHLLGFRFAPRIPNIAARRLHLFNGIEPGPDIAPLVAGRIDEALIAAHWDDVLRLTMMRAQSRLSSLCTI